MLLQIYLQLSHICVARYISSSQNFELCLGRKLSSNEFIFYMKGCKRGTTRERNRRTFEDEEKAIQDTKNLFLRTLFEYCTALGGVSCYFIVDFLDLLDVSL
jgi:hypothetical protein